MSKKKAHKMICTFSDLIEMIILGRVIYRMFKVWGEFSAILDDNAFSKC